MNHDNVNYLITWAGSLSALIILAIIVVIVAHIRRGGDKS